jgi:predicted XRE-type DNA-binding protein
MPAKQKPTELRKAVEQALDVRLTSAELVILACRLRFDDNPAMSQQDVAKRLSCSQPHVSNLERELIGKLTRAAKRHADGQANAAEMHDRHSAALAELAALGEMLPPRPLRLRQRKKRSAA